MRTRIAYGVVTVGGVGDRSAGYLRTFDDSSSEGL